MTGGYSSALTRQLGRGVGGILTMEDDEMTRTGRCLCGRVTFELVTEQWMCVSCHCRDCQYIAGGHPGVGISVPAASLKVTGPIQNYHCKADSGTEVWRGFCATCGTHLFAGNASNPDSVSVKLGTLDDAEGLAPMWHIWTASAPPWHHIDANAVRIPKQ